MADFGWIKWYKYLLYEKSDDIEKERERERQKKAKRLREV